MWAQTALERVTIPLSRGNATPECGILYGRNHAEYIRGMYIMYILKNIIKLILGVCVVCNMFGCGLYMISKNEDVVANASIGTSKATLTAGYGAEKCRIFGRLNNEVFESCPILLSAKDRYNNNIFYVNDKYVGIGNNNVF